MNRGVFAPTLLAVPIFVMLANSASVVGQARVEAVPTDPVSGVLAAFRTHAVVGLGIGAHNNEQGHAFVLTLIRAPEFLNVAADLVVECGNARYQDVMDRFVRGEDIAHDRLRRSWEDTTQPHAGCDVPLHEELYRAVRDINTTAPANLRVRVLLGDPPIDWNSPTAKQDRERFMLMRDTYPVEVIQREVLAKGRRALLLYGQGHLQRRQMVSNYEMSHPMAQTIVSLLERQGVELFTVWGNTTVDLRTLQSSVESWLRPSLTRLRGTTLGATDFAVFFTGWNRFSVEGTKLVPIPREQWRTLAIEEQFDALLYLGPPSGITVAQLPAALCADAAYMKMRLGRLDAEGPKPEADRLRQYCADAVK